MTEQSLEMSTKVQSQEQTTLAFTFGSKCWISEALEGKIYTSLGCSSRKGFDRADQRLTKSLLRADCTKVKKAAANGQEIGKGRILREPQLMTSLPRALK